MKDKILDEEFILAKKDESKVNRITSVSRYILICYLSIRLIMILIKNVSFSNVGPTETVYSIGFILSTSLFIWWLFYNFKHARLEYRSKFVMPHFKRPFIILFLLYTFGQIVIYIQRIILNIQISSLEINSILDNNFDKYYHTRIYIPEKNSCDIQ